VSAPAFTVDVGNSSVGIARWERGTPHLHRYADPREAAAALSGEIAIVSVAPARLAQLLAVLPREASARVLERPPTDFAEAGLLASAGADRIAAALALRPGPAVAVDAGTAVTVEVVDGAGHYLGGFIAPGPAAAAAGLSLAAPRLPRLNGAPAPLKPAGGTQEAIAAGLWGQAVGGVDRLVQAALEALGGGPARIVATGGWGEAWARDSRLRGVESDPALVHRGIERWARAD
jgi:pantothenate kinase type III